MNNPESIEMVLNPHGCENLVDAFTAAANENRNKPAFACGAQTLSYDQLDQLSDRFGQFLLSNSKLKAGDRIAIQLPNILHYPIAVWGALKAGLIVVNTNPMYTPRELTHQFNDSGAKALVVLDKLMPVINQVREQTGIEKVIVAAATDNFSALPAVSELAGELTDIEFLQALASASEASLPTLKAKMDDLAVLQYTGGTTGLSKGGMLSHGNLYYGMRMSRESVFQYGPEDKEIVIAPLPLYHVFGFTACVTGAALNGGLSVLIADPRNMDSMIETMKAYPFTSMASVNTLLSGMMAHPKFDSIDFSAVRGIVAGGTTLVKEIAEEWSERTQSTILEGYGLSETSAVATCNRLDNNELGSVGPPMKYQQVKIVAEDGNICEPGEAGEICLKGPNVMHGYWGREDATKESFDHDGWFLTGDVGVEDDQGRIKIVDRIKDMILVSGFNVFPNEIEEVVYSHPQVLECGAVGVPDQATGEAIKLFVVAKDEGLSADALIQHCRQGLTGYKVPKQIVFKSDLPKSPAGKILRRELRD